MSKPDLWMPFFIGDYLADTMHLSTEHHGAYILLIFAYWRAGGPIPDNNESLAATCRIAYERWLVIRPIIEQFFIVKRGFWRHKRIDHEMNKARKLQNSLKERGKSGAAARWAKDATANATANAQAMRADAPSHSPLPTTTTKSTTSAPSAKIALDAEGIWRNVSQDQLKLWHNAYPAINVPEELHRAAAWIVANPKNKKSNYARFLANWLSRSQDKAPKTGSSDGENRMGKFHI